MFPGRPKKIRKCKISFKTILLFAPLESNCRFDNKAANFPPRIRNLFAQRRKLFQEANNVFVKVFLWTRKMDFWRFCSKVSPKFEKFWLKMHFWRLLKKFRREFNQFAWKTKLNWKTNTFLMKTHQKVLGTLKMQLQQKWRNFFFKTNVFFAWVRSLKNQEILSQKKPKKYFGHVECTFGNAADSFSQSSAQLSLKVQKLSKISENMIIILEVVHWTRRKQF